MPDQHDLRRGAGAAPQPDVTPALARPAASAASTTRRLRPIAEKAGITLGMAMTEKQGGSDVRANTTRALPGRAAGRLYRLVGHKWFCSAPMSDGFLTLAQADGGLSCFLVPRILPDGNAQHAPADAAQGQARQPLERLHRDRVPRHLRLAPRARRAAASTSSSTWCTTPASAPSPPRSASCAWRWPQAVNHVRGPPRLPEAADRPAADARASSPTSRSSTRPRLALAVRVGAPSRRGRGRALARLSVAVANTG